jgi:putative transcriptional regulator
MDTKQHSSQRRFVTTDIPMPPVPEFDPLTIKAIRERFKISQATLAKILNLSLGTVRQWEIGVKRPSGSSAKLLDLLARKGIEILS